jgi:hypothetical protein
MPQLADTTEVSKVLRSSVPTSTHVSRFLSSHLPKRYNGPAHLRLRRHVGRNQTARTVTHRSVSRANTCTAQSDSRQRNLWPLRTLSGFLRYVVEETLRGNSSTLKEQVIAHDVYGRGDGYDPNADPIVRVDARRLRDKLREYYAEADGESIVISLPKGSYVPSFERNSATLPVVVAAPGPEPVVIRAPPRLRSRIVWLASAVAVILIAGAAWYVPRPPVADLHVRPLTSLPG